MPTLYGSNGKDSRHFPIDGKVRLLGGLYWRKYVSFRNILSDKEEVNLQRKGPGFSCGDFMQKRETILIFDSQVAGFCSRERGMHIKEEAPWQLDSHFSCGKSSPEKNESDPRRLGLWVTEAAAEQDLPTPRRTGCLEAVCGWQMSQLLSRETETKAMGYGLRAKNWRPEIYEDGGGHIWTALWGMALKVKVAQPWCLHGRPVSRPWWADCFSKV